MELGLFNVVLFIVTLIVSFAVVRVGAVAFQLTGLEWSVAKFQSLSCFSGTGFTTREAELIVGNPRRRRIASILIVMGNAGIVAMIATFANSMRPALAQRESTLAWFWGGFGPLAKLMLFAGALYLTFRFFQRSDAGSRFTRFLRTRVSRSPMMGPVSCEELLVASGGYGVIRADIHAGSPLIGQTLATSGLRSKDVTVLVIRRGAEPISNPPAHTTVLEDDELLCFGKLDQMRAEFRSEKL